MLNVLRTLFLYAIKGIDKIGKRTRLIIDAVALTVVIVALLMWL